MVGLVPLMSLNMNRYNVCFSMHHNLNFCHQYHVRQYTNQGRMYWAYCLMMQAGRPRIIDIDWLGSYVYFTYSENSQKRSTINLLKLYHLKWCTPKMWMRWNNSQASGRFHSDRQKQHSRMVILEGWNGCFILFSKKDTGSTWFFNM